MGQKDFVEGLGNQDGREQRRKVGQRCEYTVYDIRTEWGSHVHKSGRLSIILMRRAWSF